LKCEREKERQAVFATGARVHQAPPVA